MKNKRPYPLLFLFLLCISSCSSSIVSSPSAEHALQPAASNSPEVSGVDFLSLKNPPQCQFIVNATYHAQVKVGQSETMSFSASGYNLSNSQPYVYFAETHVLTNATSFSSEDFPSKFTQARISLNAQASYQYVPQSPKDLTGFVLWIFGPQGAPVFLCTPYMHIVTTNNPQTGGSAGDVKVILKEIDGLSHQNAALSFAHLFKFGDYLPQQIAAEIVETGNEVPIQVEVLRKHPDGSIRHALISVLVPSLPASASVTVRLLHRAPAVLPPAFQWPNLNAFDPQLILTGTNGSTNRIAKLSQVVADPKACVAIANAHGEQAAWRYFGSLVRQCVVWGKVRQASGALDQELDFSIRYTLRSGNPSIKVDFVLENAHVKLDKLDSTSTFHDHYFSNAVLTSGGQTLWQNQQALTLWSGTRWRFIGYQGAKFPDPEIHWDSQYLYQARGFDLTAGPTAYNHIDQYGVALFSPPNQLNTLPRNMGQTGGAWWIGPNTELARSWFSTMNRKALQAVETIDSNPANSNYEVIYRSSTSTYAQQPGGPIGVGCTTGSNGKLQSPWKDLNPGVTNSPNSPDMAHEPRFGFTSYAMTGELFYEESMLFWVMWNTATNTWPEHCIPTGPERTVAWTTRNLIDAAYLVSDTNPRKDLLQTYVEKTSDYWLKSTVQSGRYPQIIDEAGTKELYMSGRLNWVNAGRFSPWQYDWICWSFQLASKRGYNSFDPIRDWVCQTVMDLYNVEDDRSQDFMITEYDAAGAAVTNIYSYPAAQAHAYGLANRLYPTLQANQLTDQYGNPVPCDFQKPALLSIGKPSRQFQNWGELWYWTLVNSMHEGWPMAHNCTNGFQYPTNVSGQNPQAVNSYLADGRQWSTYNGWAGLTGWNGYANTNHRYGHEPGTTAVLEATWDQSATANSSLNRAQAEKMYYQKYLSFVSAPKGIDFIPGVLLP